MHEPTLYVTVAAPAAGKSTYIENVLSKIRHTAIVSTDEIREELFGNDSLQNSGNIIFKTAYERTERFLKFRLNVIFDSTAAKPVYRQNLIKIGKDNGAKIICVYFNIPLEIHFERNRGRIRFVPHDVIETMYNNIKKNPPALSEGFDEIMEILE